MGGGGQIRQQLKTMGLFLHVLFLPLNTKLQVYLTMLPLLSYTLSLALIYTKYHFPSSILSSLPFFLPMSPYSHQELLPISRHPLILLFLLQSSSMAWSADTLPIPIPSYSNSLLSYQHLTIPLLCTSPSIISLPFLDPPPYTPPHL